MGLKLMSTCQHGEEDKESNLGASARTYFPNPDPTRFKIFKHEVIGKHVIVLVYYPNCTNYDGLKVLFFRNTKLEDVIQSERLDPHFCPLQHLSPFARFEPTEDGWKAARIMARQLEE